MKSSEALRIGTEAIRQAYLKTLRPDVKREGRGGDKERVALYARYEEAIRELEKLIEKEARNEISS